MARWPYRVLKDLYDTVFRVDLNKNFEDVAADIKDTNNRLDTILAEPNDANLEIVDARDGEKSLGNKIRLFNALMDSLKQQKADINYVNQKMTGTPKIVKATLAELTSSFPSGSTELALVTADGFLYQWTSNTWKKTIQYQSLGIADGSVTYKQQTKLGKVGFIMPSQTNSIPDYDPSTFIFDFKSTLGAEPSIVYGNETYVIPPGTTVNLKPENQTSTFKLYFNTVTKEFKTLDVNANTGLNEDDIIIATGRNTTGRMAISCPYTVKGVIPAEDGSVTYKKQTKLGKIGYILPSHTNGVPNYEVSTGILDFKSTLGAEPTIVWGNESYAIPPGTTVDLKTPIVPSSTTFKLYFNTKDKTFLVLTSTSTSGITDDHILLATGRSSTGLMSISCPYTINGLPAHAALDKDLSNYSIISTTEPTFSVKTGGIVSITPPKYLYLLTSTGKQTAVYTDTTTVSYDVGQNQMLIWNVDDNKLVVQGNNVSRNPRNIVLASVYNSKIQNGYLKPWFDIVKMPTKPYTHIVFGNLTTIKITGSLVDMGMVTMYAIGYDGQNAKQYTFLTNNNKFTLEHNQILIWDWDNNIVKVAGNNDVRPMKFSILAYYRENIITQGELLPFVNNGYIQDGKPVTAESRVWNIPNKVADQGLTIVGEEIWVFRASLYNHSNTAAIHRYDKNTFEEKTDYVLQHNLGHCATADYNHKNDILITGNGESAPTVKGTMHFIKNPLSFVENKQLIDFYNPGDKIMSIDFFEENEDGTIKREIGGSGLIGCWGERDNIIYIMTGQDIPHRIFRVRLGMGAEDLSNASGDAANITNWGVFQSGKSDTEYNGTARIEKIFTGVEYGVSQGMAWYNGRIFYCVDNAETLEIELLPNGTFKTVKAYRHYENNQADGFYWEPEGCAILDGRYLLMGRRNSTGMAWSIFPLYNEQGGKGATGQQIILPFPCNSIPQIRITATSPTTDLYVSQVDKSTFTVLSASGGTGTFNWECRIS
ncbi:hypothetical protein [Niallia nealsonii]|uniref:Uncharacterized protein n=1 Tax=Niallia nealsonii TaxID=115979 RepID=A0A2N0Z351_9BACI|nr:hypothetical protein [Niallia nealsonii]PKG23951.1 hypothetical protein CWS01_09285 [Niallia nealsonii]